MSRQTVRINGVALSISLQEVREKLPDMVPKLRCEYGDHQISASFRSMFDPSAMKERLVVVVKCRGCSWNAHSQVSLNYTSDAQTFLNVAVKLFGQANQEFQSSLPASCGDARLLHIASAVLES